MSFTPRIRALSLRAVGVAGALVAAQLSLLPGVASAASLTVTSTADVATSFGACGTPGQTTSSGSLREAVCAANNAGVTSSTITVAAGTYHLTSGELQMGKVPGSNITLTGAGAASTIIDAGGFNRVLDLDPNIVGGVTTTISGVTISGGTDATFGGAGIIAGSGHAVLLDSLTLSNSTVTNNTVNTTASNKPGGGIQFEGGSLSITNSTISNNSAGSSPGGGVSYTAEGASAGEVLSISGTTFSGNHVNASVANVNMGGGALETSTSAASPTFTVINSRFINNTVTGSGLGVAHGGAIFSQTGPLNVTGSTFTGNSVIGGAAAYGGAISVTGGAPTLHYNRFTGNTAATGSAVAIPYANGTTVNATENWWGCNTGPGTAGCDSATGGPTVSPRLVLTAAASPATLVGPNATSTITGALTQDSLGSAVGAGNLGAFAGLPIGWSDPLPSGSTLTAASSNISSGSASTSYNSQNTSGPGHVLATLDNGTATAAITVNRTPAITSANSASFTTGTASSFTVTTTGYPAPAISQTGTVPPGMTYTDNGNGTATLSGTPTAGGSYPLGLTANNGVAPNATQTLTVTVGQAPAFTSASTTTFTTGTAGSFSVTTTGVPTPTITKTGTLPSGLTFTDNLDGTATLAGTPAGGTGGAYPLDLTASNGVSPDGTQALTVTVNEAPAVTTNPSNQSVNPAATTSFTAAAGGFPAPTVQWQRSTDGGGTFSNITGATSATYTFTAAVTDNANKYRAVFTNVVSSATSTAATLTVSSAPTISSASTTTFAVGAAGTFAVTTSGFPNPTLTTTGTLPAWLSFTDNLDGTGTLSGTPPVGSGGTYGFTLNADNGNNPSASQAFTLAVNESPTITSASSTTFQVGTAGSFAVTTSAGFPVATTVSETDALPAGVTFTDNGNGTGTLAGTPTASGSFPLTMKASNRGAPDATQLFTLTIQATPVITSADHATFAVGTAGSFTVTTTAGNPASTTLTKTGTLPSGVTFTDNHDGTATLAGTPAAGTGGTYPLTITASNGTGTDPRQSFTLTVNAPPTITSANSAAFLRGTADAFTVTTNPGVPSSTTLTETGALPSGVTFSDNGDGTATLGGTATASGSFPFTIKASNGVAPDATQSFTLTVNEAPAITSADHTTFAVGAAGTFTVTTTAGFPATTTLTRTGTLPSGVTFTDNGNGSATLAGTPAAGTGGTYPLTITAGNGTGTDAQQSFTLTVTDVPSISSANAASVTVASPLSFTVTTTAGFPTATVLSQTGTLPSGVTFTDNGDGTATLAGTPAAGTGGSYPLTLTATNTAGHADQAFTLTVNEPPTITSADHTTFAVGGAGTFTVTTTAGFPTATTLTRTGALPSGVTFTDNGDGTATLAGTPAAGTGGTYPLALRARSGTGFDDNQSFTLTVTELPSISSANATDGTVGSPLSFTVTTTAGFPTATVLSQTGALASGLTFTDNGDGTATLAGTPAAATGGSYPLTLTATNTAGHADQAFTLSILESPAITSANAVTLPAGAPGSFTVTTAGGFPTPATITKTGALPAGLTLTDNGNGTATLAGTPAATAGGVHPLTFIAGGPGAPSASQPFTLTVTVVPTITAPTDASVTLGGGSLTVPISSTGYPTSALTTASVLPSGITLVDHGDGTAVLSGTPTGPAADYAVVLHAANGAGTADKTVTVHVLAPAPPPPPASPSASPSASASASATPSGRSALSLSVRNPDITPGQVATLTVSGTNGAPVELRCYTRPDTTYRTVRSATLAQGVAAFGLRPGSNTRCYARYAGDDSTATPSVVINVHMVISIGAVQVAPLTYVFSGRTLPRTSGQLVTLYRLGATGQLIRTATAVTDNSGVWRLTRRFQVAGSQRFVARISTANNAAGISTPPYAIRLH